MIELRVNIIQSVNTLLGLPLQLPMLLRPRLEEIQKHFALFDADTSKATDEALLGNVAPNALQFAASVPFVLPMRSRATLYIYFNAAVGLHRLDRIFQTKRDSCVDVPCSTTPCLSDFSMLATRYVLTLTVTVCFNV